MPEETAIAMLKQETIPEWFLIQAIKVKNNFYFRLIAINKNTSDSLLEKLAKDGNILVRIAVAENQNTSIELLKKLVQDKINYVSFFAAKQITKKLSKYEKILPSELFQYSSKQLMLK